MNFSTNQVTQFYVLKENSVVTYPTSGDRKYLTIDGERTDFISKFKYGKVANADDASELLKRKGVLITLNSNVNSGAPVAGEDYVITLTYRGHIGEENTYHKFASAHAVTGTTAAQLLQDLAKSFFANQNVEYSPLYELYIKGASAAACYKLLSNEQMAAFPAFSTSVAYAAGDIVAYTSSNVTKIYKTKTGGHSAGAWDASDFEVLYENVASITSSGFYIVEPAPYWLLGRFPKNLMKIDLSTNKIVVDGDVVEKWLTTYAFAPIATTEIASLAAIVNSSKVADMEYFYKGEKGTSAGLHVPYEDQIDLNLKVNGSLSSGYDILTFHYAFAGANQQSTLSEKTIVMVIPADTTFSLNGTSNKTLADVLAVVDDWV